MILRVSVTDEIWRGGGEPVAELTIELVDTTADEEVFTVRATVDRGSATGVYQYPIYTDRHARLNPLGLLRAAVNQMPSDYQTMDGDVVYSSDGRTPEGTGDDHGSASALEWRQHRALPPVPGEA